jgi:hypothetical protein
MYALSKTTRNNISTLCLQAYKERLFQRVFSYPNVQAFKEYVQAFKEYVQAFKEYVQAFKEYVQAFKEYVQAFK